MMSFDLISRSALAVVYGQFVEELKNLNLRFRGSSNQRIIDVQQSLDLKRTVLRKDV